VGAAGIHSASETPGYGNFQNGVPVAIVIPVWERHLPAISIEARRLSHGLWNGF
jgi:hypothetical protein